MKYETVNQKLFSKKHFQLDVQILKAEMWAFLLTNELSVYSSPLFKTHACLIEAFVECGSFRISEISLIRSFTHQKGSIVTRNV